MEVLKGMLFSIGLILAAILLALLGALLFFPLLILSFLLGILGIAFLCIWFFIKTPPVQQHHGNKTEGSSLD